MAHDGVPAAKGALGAGCSGWGSKAPRASRCTIALLCNQNTLHRRLVAEHPMRIARLAFKPLPPEEPQGRVAFGHQQNAQAQCPLSSHRSSIEPSAGPRDRAVPPPSATHPPLSTLSQTSAANMRPAFLVVLIASLACAAAQAPSR